MRLMKNVVHAACSHDCPDACGVLITVEDGRATKIQGDPAHPVTRGFLCAKVAKYLERVYSPARVLYPMRRVVPKGIAGEQIGQPGAVVPTWPLLLVEAFRGDSPHGIQHPVGRVHPIKILGDFGAQKAASDRVSRVTLDFCRPPILDGDQYPAGIRTVMRTSGMDNVLGHGLIIR